MPTGTIGRKMNLRPEPEVHRPFGSCLVRLTAQAFQPRPRQDPALSLLSHRAVTGDPPETTSVARGRVQRAVWPGLARPILKHPGPSAECPYSTIPPRQGHPRTAMTAAVAWRLSHVVRKMHGRCSSCRDGWSRTGAPLRVRSAKSRAAVGSAAGRREIGDIRDTSHGCRYETRRATRRRLAPIVRRPAGHDQPLLLARS